MLSQYGTFCDSFTSVCEIVLCILPFFMSLSLLCISENKINQNLSCFCNHHSKNEVIHNYTFCLWPKRKLVLCCLQFAWLWFVFIDPYWHVEVCCGLLLCQREQISEETSHWWPDPFEGSPYHSSLCSAKKRGCLKAFMQFFSFLGRWGRGLCQIQLISSFYKLFCQLLEFGTASLSVKQKHTESSRNTV